jgi:hypothetical protein
MLYYCAFQYKTMKWNPAIKRKLRSPPGVREVITFAVVSLSRLQPCGKRECITGGTHLDMHKTECTSAFKTVSPVLCALNEGQVQMSGKQHHQGVGRRCGFM